MISSSFEEYNPKWDNYQPTQEKEAVVADSKVYQEVAVPVNDSTTVKDVQQLLDQARRLGADHDSRIIVRSVNNVTAVAVRVTAPSAASEGKRRVGFK